MSNYANSLEKHWNLPNHLIYLNTFGGRNHAESGANHFFTDDTECVAILWGLFFERISSVHNLSFGLRNENTAYLLSLIMIGFPFSCLWSILILAKLQKSTRNTSWTKMHWLDRRIVRKQLDIMPTIMLKIKEN